MSRLALVDRVKSWFGVRPKRKAPGVTGWTMPGAAPQLALAAVAASEADLDDMIIHEDTPPPAPAPERPRDRKPPEPKREKPPEPMPQASPEWLERLEALPERIAEAVADSAAGAKALERIAAELDGHRAAGTAVAEAVRQLPAAGEAHAALVAETNRLLERQNLLTEAMIDGLTGLRAAFRSIEESSMRHLACLGQLEATHRQVLEVYQTTLLAAHRRTGRLAALAAFVAAVAIGAAAYAIYLTTL